MLTLQQIIDEAYTLVPNEVDVADQVIWLNQVNQDFFNVVKIPKIANFTTTRDLATYTLPSAVQQRNIDLVMVGVLKYLNLYEDAVSPLQNRYGFDDDTKTLTLNPAPYNSGLQGLVRYRKIATTTFLSSNLNAVPDAPEEWQWTYIPALASYLAHTQDDEVKASNYEMQCRNAWNTAALNYQASVVGT